MLLCDILYIYIDRKQRSSRHKSHADINKYNHDTIGK